MWIFPKQKSMWRETKEMHALKPTNQKHESNTRQAHLTVDCLVNAYPEHHMQGVVVWRENSNAV